MKMPNKKQRNRAIQSEIKNREFEESLAVFTDEELRQYEYLSTCNAAEMNEQECEELISLEKFRKTGIRKEYTDNELLEFSDNEALKILSLSQQNKRDELKSKI